VPVSADPRAPTDRLPAAVWIRMHTTTRAVEPVRVGAWISALSVPSRRGPPYPTEVTVTITTRWGSVELVNGYSYP